MLFWLLREICLYVEKVIVSKILFIYFLLQIWAKKLVLAVVAIYLKWIIYIGKHMYHKP